MGISEIDSETDSDTDSVRKPRSSTPKKLKPNGIKIIRDANDNWLRAPRAPSRVSPKVAVAVVVPSTPVPPSSVPPKVATAVVVSSASVPPSSVPPEDVAVPEYKRTSRKDLARKANELLRKRALRAAQGLYYDSDYSDSDDDWW